MTALAHQLPVKPHQVALPIVGTDSFATTQTHLSSLLRQTDNMQHISVAEQMRLDPTSRMASSRQWPGERHPTRWDVHDANESPAVTFLERFRAALLHSEGAEEDALLDSDSVIDSSENMNTVSLMNWSMCLVPNQQLDSLSDHILIQWHCYLMFQRLLRKNSWNASKQHFSLHSTSIYS